MKWKKLGKIFDPTVHPAFSEYAGFAQSPQALVLSDRVRIYFSTRKKDVSGKFISHVSFIDMDRGMRKIIGEAKQPVLSPGKLGAFDEHGIFPINPLRVDDRVLAFTCGWSRRVSVSVETSIGLAVSHNDGLTFERYGDGPVMSSSIHEPFLVGDAFVIKEEKGFDMWYIYGLRWIQYPGETEPDRVYKIAYASSKDGVEWRRDSRPIISDILDSDECQALPSVLKIDGVYHMVFCFRHATGFRKIPGRGYRLGYAVSANKTEWSRCDDQLGISGTTDDWDSDMMCYPHLFECDGNVYLLYNGNEFGRYGFGLAVLEAP